MPQLPVPFFLEAKLIPALDPKPSMILDSFSEEDLANVFLLDLNCVSAEIFMACQILAGLLVKKTKERSKIFEERRSAYFRFLKIRYKESVFRNEKKVKDFSEFIGTRIGKKHHETALSHRQSGYYKSIDLRDSSLLNVSS